MNTETRHNRQAAPPQLGREATPEAFAVQLSSTRRGARLARRLAVQHLAECGIPYDSPLSHSVALVTAELAANAVRHCGGTGRDFRLRVLIVRASGTVRASATVRVEVTDACADRPLTPGPPEPAPDGTSGHGLVLVDALATRWGSSQDDAITKTVWAELERGVGAEPG